MGNHHKNIIEINGKRYDAVSGQLLHEITAPKAAAAKSKLQPSAGGSMDGVVRSTKKHHTHPVASHAVKHVQKSQTLMRSAVHKPHSVPKENQTKKSIFQKPLLGIPKDRAHKAHITPKSERISRFGDLQHRSSVIKKVEALPVQPLLTHSDTPLPPVHHVAAMSAHASSLTKPPSAAESLLDKALASASSHEQPVHKATKKQRRIAHKLGVSSRTMAISMSVLAGVLLGGFFAVQNIPNLSMRVASARAGFDAKMPAYKPSGFSFKGPISYSPGRVTVSFKSNTDDRLYSVTQRTSNWNSDALLANFVLAENKQYQTYLDRGRTLYIYEGSNATWVDNGVWYQIEGKSDMTTDQLVRIAASI